MSEEPKEEGESVAGERGAASVQAARSLQSRVSNVLAMGLMGTLGVGFLGWYYAHTFARQGEVKRAAQSASRNQAAGEMALPSLGKIDPPAAPITKLLGAPPEAPPALADSPPPAMAPTTSTTYGAPPAQKPAWM